ncbi:hypothetical protein [Massilia sp. PWRC2]|uniref:hypothetical protein n=1 Tax=Massilia sp. PWRC2 TaxID=2804626 RepID=UPI003CEB0A8B
MTAASAHEKSAQLRCKSSPCPGMSAVLRLAEHLFRDRFHPPEYISASLAFFLREHEVQFILAVFSAVPKGFRSTPSSAPYVEGNPSYWSGEECDPQLDGALFEIACWDSSGTILINLAAQAAQSFVSKFTDMRPLATARL